MNEAAAMTAGPATNLTAMANEASEFPQAIIFGCRAINKPFKYIYPQNFN